MTDLVATRGLDGVGVSGRECQVDKQQLLWMHVATSR